MRLKQYLLTERQIFHEAPEEIAKHFKSSYDKRALEKIRLWLEKYKKKLQAAGSGGYAKELSFVVSNLTKAAQLI